MTSPKTAAEETRPRGDFISPQIALKRTQEIITPVVTVMHSYPRPASPTNGKPEVNANEIHLGHWVLARNRKFAKFLVISSD